MHEKLKFKKCKQKLESFPLQLTQTSLSWSIKIKIIES